MKDIFFNITKPSTADYNKLRAAVNWHSICSERAAISLDNSLFCVCATYHGEIIGMGRVIGDGAVYFYIQDMIIIPAHQSRGIGNEIMTLLMGYINEVAPKKSGAFVGLMSAPGAVKLYSKHGFKLMTDGSPLLSIWYN
jgi:ribosomal protein S18 acetylase RimI-like enzyme